MSKQFRHILKTSPFEIDRLPKFLGEAFEGINVKKDYFNMLLLAITEAVNNAIVHGNKSNITKKVILELTVTDSTIKIDVTDEGEGFDIEKIPDPTLPENLLREHGRGVYIMKHFVDEMYYTKSKEGNSLTLISEFKLEDE
ncbi:MAG: ATP-binding protein [Ignavibacteria bacterium]|nr:ATP-binding protein [Ignavibacteria bacterium]